MAKKIVSFQVGSTTRPALEITDKNHQVMVRFLPYGDEHTTIHLQDDNTLLRTHHSENKPRSVWDGKRVETATVLGYKDPERHGQYIAHNPLFKVQNIEGYHLVGRHMSLHDYQPKQKYLKRNDLLITVPSFKFMLTLYLSTKDNPRNSKNFVSTSVGDICIELSYPNQNEAL